MWALALIVVGAATWLLTSQLGLDFTASAPQEQIRIVEQWVLERTNEGIQQHAFGHPDLSVDRIRWEGSGFRASGSNLRFSGPVLSNGAEPGRAEGYYDLDEGQMTVTLTITGETEQFTFDAPAELVEQVREAKRGGT